MVRKLLAAAIAIAVGASLTLGAAEAQEGPPPPPGAETLVTGLNTQGGSVIGPDGALYVPELGTGGDTELTAPPGVGLDEAEIRFGTTAQITRVDTATGETSVAASGLPSLFIDGEPSGGPIDVAFLNGDLYYLTTGSLDKLGEADWPNGVYQVEDDGSSTLIANISEFNDANPVEFEDQIPGGNPFAFDVRGTEFIVNDGNFNRTMRASLDGEISLLAQFDNVVPTGVESPAGGPIWITQLGAFPHPPESGKLVQLGYPSGAITELASGFSQLIDVQLGPDGRVYVLQFGDPPESPESPEGPPGRLLLFEDGELKPLVEGVIIPVSLNISGDTAFITSLTGSVWVIEGVSALEPIEAQPTPGPTQAPAATPTPSGITAPDTGSGSASETNNVSWFILAAVAGGVAVLGTAATSMRRR
jgi:hypothetical protein